MGLDTVQLIDRKWCWTTNIANADANIATVVAPTTRRAEQEATSDERSAF